MIRPFSFGLLRTWFELPRPRENRKFPIFSAQTNAEKLLTPR
jgi:hypothetical protein